MVSLGFIFALVNMLVMTIFNLIFQGFQEIMNRLIMSLIVDETIIGILQDGRINDMFDFTIGLSVGLLILISVYQGFKVFFAFYGFQPEDEPYTILTRSVFLFIAINTSRSFVELFYGFYGDIAKFAYELVDGNLSSLMGLSVFGVVYGATGFFSFVMMMFVYLCTRVFMVALRFAERYILAILIAVCVPLGFATLCSKATRDIGTAFFKVFFGNMIVQFVQIVGLVVVYQMAQIDLGDPDQWINLFLVLGALIVVERIDDIVAAAGITTGLSAFTLDSNRRQLTNLVEDVRQTTKMFVPESISKRVS